MEDEEFTPDNRMAESLTTGRQLDMFLTMREILAERLDGASTRDTAGIARQLERVIQLVDALENGVAVTDDKLAAFMDSEWNAR